MSKWWSKTPKKQTSGNLSEEAARIEGVNKNRASELDLSFKNLTELPESIGQLTQLRVLYLFGNQLTRLPESIGQLTQLQVLRLFAARVPRRVTAARVDQHEHRRVAALVERLLQPVRGVLNRLARR